MSFKQLTGALAFLAVLQAPIDAAGRKMMVYKTATCGCCSKWVEHMKVNGFDVSVTNVPSTAEYRRQQGVPDRLQSCHTAVINGYTIEGHVPAADVKRLLKERPAAIGLSVPGMPMGSPGMEGARRDAFSVILLGKNGNVSIYRNYSL